MAVTVAYKRAQFHLCRGRKRHLILTYYCRSLTNINRNLGMIFSEGILVVKLLIHLPQSRFKDWTSSPFAPSEMPKMLLHRCVCVCQLTTAVPPVCVCVSLYLYVLYQTGVPRSSLIYRGRVNRSRWGSRWSRRLSRWRINELEPARSISTTGQTQTLLTDTFTAEVCLTVESMSWSHIRYGQRRSTVVKTYSLR